MQNNKFWKWISVVLLLCNTVLLVLLLLRPGHGHGPHDPHKVDTFIIDELNLTESQQKEFSVLKKEHHKKIQALRNEGKELRNTYFSELKQTTPNDSLVMEKAQAIANNQKEIELATFNHFRALRNICTNAQKTAFDKIILEVLKRMGPPPHPPGGNHNTPPPPVN